MRSGFCSAFTESVRTVTFTLAGRGDPVPDGRPLRDLLVIPLTAVITLMWSIAGIAALVTGETYVFGLASGPFVMVCGYAFGIKLEQRRGGTQ